MRNISILVILSLFVLVGCDTADNSDTVTDYKGLTSEYLVGDWCYTHYQVMDPSSKEVVREEIQQNFIFSADGTYLTQQSSYAEMTTKGHYEFRPQGVFKFIIGETTVVTVNPDDFVLHKTVDHYFYRGGCK